MVWYGMVWYGMVWYGIDYGMAVTMIEYIIVYLYVGMGEQFSSRTNWLHAQCHLSLC